MGTQRETGQRPRLLNSAAMLHFGYVEQLQNWQPASGPWLTVRKIMVLPHLGHAFAVFFTNACMDSMQPCTFVRQAFICNEFQGKST